MSLVRAAKRSAEEDVIGDGGDIHMFRYDVNCELQKPAEEEARWKW
jgi:fermentation-respiration switch protein FrsA (DUF1100 family)